MPKQRLDTLLVERGLVVSRTAAQTHIMSGRVFSGTVRLDKPGHMVAEDIELSLDLPESQFVSRGGQKLIHGLEHFALNVAGFTAIDVGASTGGFTDVLLQNGAAKVYAVDVGHGQLDWKLRNDERVVVLEKTNARYLTREQIPDAADIVVCDASFIGLKTVLPAALALAKPNALAIALIKPQFEVGKGQVGKGGVVKDPALHQAVCDDIASWFEGAGWQLLGITESPIKGPKGNIEFLIGARRGE